MGDVEAVRDEGWEEYETHRKRSKTMYGQTLRCAKCGTLLAIRDEQGVRAQRGRMKISVSGAAFSVAIECHRADCGHESVFHKDGGAPALPEPPKRAA